ncbi:D-alanyl-D-alanine carboxypeptidase family protein [Salipaludibacillus aurantiacus]|uniref:serine-type D-Ala-D-Ala carboxypeptidase n=1 Tax=Salipaludibacillus aurantiacus TaxID=1601833 RepID=A0A1H9X813_9BACI|nr:D-alanyl-D-alanine carboxypeptidase family protein [Salipaludibacillus aurantiacus]SES42280.1 D-alanyl-D-alanine carboxypeptidase (penicillin-binding protein 5/6) [Salipaludibacillus aurantiacus]
MFKKVNVWMLIMMFSFVSVFTYTGTAEASFQPGVDTVILVDGDSGKILYEQNAEQALPPASMTKMMSEYLILEAVNKGDIAWNDTVPVSDHLAELSHDRGLSNVPMRTDEEYTVEELYESIAIYSANAATMALAEYISGSEGAFVEEMNEKGKELGMGETLREAGQEYGLDNLEEIAAEGFGDYQFVNTTGLPNRLLNGMHPDGTGSDEDNYMSAKAAATLAYHLVNDYPEVLDVASIPEKVFREGTDDAVNMQNWNWMIEGTQLSDLDNQYVDGLKTGHTNAAGFTFTGTAERDGQRLVSVVMGADSEVHRFQETERLMEWGFNNFSMQEIFPGDMTLDGYETVPVAKGQEDEVAIASTDSVSMVIHEDDEEAYTYSVELDESMLNEDGELEAPIEEGTVVGRMAVEYNGENEAAFLPGEGNQLAVDVVTTENVERAGWFSLMARGIGDFFSGLWTSVADTVRGWF